MATQLQRIKSLEATVDQLVAANAMLAAKLENLEFRVDFRAEVSTPPAPPRTAEYCAVRSWLGEYSVVVYGGSIRAFTLKRLAKKMERHATPRVKVTYCKSRAK